MLWSSVVGQLVYLFRSALPGLVVGTSSTAIPFLGSAAAAMVASLDPATAATALAPTVFLFLAVAGLLNGAIMYLCGIFNLGRFLHFFPLPVTKGFFAAIGVRFAPFLARPFVHAFALIAPLPSDLPHFICISHISHLPFLPCLAVAA
jgi:MFS superfamily sulfate permease-like transporter